MSLSSKRHRALGHKLRLGLAQVDPEVARVARAEARVGVVRVLVRVEAHLAGRAADLDAGALALAGARRADLDVVVPERRADEARAAAVEVAQVPVQPVGPGVLELQDAAVEVGIALADLDRGAGAVLDPAEIDDLARLHGKGRGARLALADTVGARVATAVVGLVDVDRLVAPGGVSMWARNESKADLPVVEVQVGVGDDGRGQRQDGGESGGGVHFQTKRSVVPIAAKE